MKLQLRVTKTDDGWYTGTVVHQDGMVNGVFECGGYKMMSMAYPQFDESDRTLFVRGSYRENDMVSFNFAAEHLEGIRKLVAAYNATEKTPEESPDVFYIQ